MGLKIGFVLALSWLKLALFGFVCLNNQLSQLLVFTCHKRAYVIFGVLDFGFVLHKKLINSYVIFRRFPFLGLGPLLRSKLAALPLLYARLAAPPLL